MGFFDQPEETDEPDVDQFDNYDDGTSPWEPGRALLDRVLAQATDAALVLSNVRVVDRVIGFEITALIRHTVRMPLDHDPFGNAWAYSGSTKSPPPEFVRVGMEWPDGGRAFNGTRYGRQNLPTEPPAYVLGPDGGGGTRRRYNWPYTAWPLPEEGDLTLYVEWPAQSIGETAVTLDGVALREASARSRPLWPEDQRRAPAWWDRPS